jgi:type I restriction enzyme M protein
MVAAQEQLAEVIWKCVQILRGRVTPDEYAKYIITLVFLKAVHHDHQLYVRDIGSGIEEIPAWETTYKNLDYTDFHGFVSRLRQALPIDLSELILQSEIDRYVGFLRDDTVRLAKIVDELTFDDESRTALTDILMRLFEHPYAKKTAGLYTPKFVSHLLAKLMRYSGSCKIYDPACGTGYLLVCAYREAVSQCTDRAQVRLFGQDIAEQTTVLAKMIMVISGISSFDIRSGDTLLSPWFTLADHSVQRFDSVVSALPFGAFLTRDKEDSIARDVRFPRGFSTNADLLFVEHIIASLSEVGRAVVLAASGALFRSGRDSLRRADIVNSDLIEAVIELPSNVLADTSVPPAIIILNRNKPEILRNQVLFVDAKRCFSKHAGQVIFEPNEQQRIISTIENAEEQIGFSRLVSIKDIASRDFVLIPSTYLQTPHSSPNGFLVKSAERVQLQNIADILPGVRDSNAAIKGEGTTPIIQGRDISVLSLTKENLEHIRIVGELRNGLYTQPGDILIQRIGEKPSAYLVEEELGGVLVWSTVFVIRLKEKHHHLRHFLVEYLNSPVWYEYLSRMRSSSAGAPTLSLTVLQKAEVPIPQQESISALRDLYEVERDFQVRLNKLRELKDSLFNIEDDASLQCKIQEISIRERITIQTLQQAGDFDYQVRNLYPYALAYPYRLLSGITNPPEVYPEQLRVGENLMAFFGSITLSLLAHSGLYTDSKFAWLGSKLKDWWQGGISPGDWQEMGRRIAQTLRECAYEQATEVTGVWFKAKSSRPSEFRNNISTLGERLNDYKHSRGPKTPIQYKEAVSQTGTLLRSCLEQVSLLTQFPMHQVVSSNLDWRSSQIILKTLMHVGDHPGHNQHESQSSKLLPTDHLYMLSGSDEWISLYPLMTAQYCPSCQTLETYMVDRWDGLGGRLVLKSFERGHTVDTSRDDSIATKLRDDFEHFVRIISGDADAT